MSVNENIKPIFFNQIQLHDFFPEGIGDTIFLGVANALNYFGIDLSYTIQ